MLRKMYLVSADSFKQPSISPLSAAQPKAPLPKKKKKKRQKQKKREHPYEKWVKYRKMIREADIKRKTQIQAIAEFLKNVLPDKDIAIFGDADGGERGGGITYSSNCFDFGRGRT